MVVAKPQEQERALECLQAGADDFLTRPLAPEMLAFKVRKFLSSPNRKEQSAGINGSLGDMNLVDMIQILSAGGRSVEIAVAHGDRQGRVVMENGEIVHARCGDNAGDNALYEILRWETGDFTTRPTHAPAERTIRGSVMSLLMESARVADETRSDGTPNGASR
jgi:CheY-like chemotaxis protein